MAQIFTDAEQKSVAICEICGQEGGMTKRIAVEWQVLLEEDAWDDDEAVVPSPPTQTIRPVKRSLREAAGLMALLLALVGYGLWSSGSVLAAQAGDGDSHRPALSADRLAGQSRQVILTEHLRIYAAGADVATVQADAAALEAAYVGTFAAVGAPLLHGGGAPDGRFVVVVAGDSLGEWDTARGTVYLPSPALQSAAGGWSDGALLRQSWAIALAERAAREAGIVHDVPVGWQPLLGGLRLRLLRRAGGPLAAGVDEIVAWRYGEAGAALPSESRVRICDAFALWQRTPLDFGLPVACGPADAADLPLSPPPRTLSALGLPEAGWSIERETEGSLHSPADSARSLALALLIEQTVEVYGPDSLPRLLAAPAEYDSWETLFPAVYGESVAYFVLRIP